MLFPALSCSVSCANSGPVEHATCDVSRLVHISYIRPPLHPSRPLRRGTSPGILLALLLRLMACARPHPPPHRRVADCPGQMLPLFHEAAWARVLEMFPNYGNIRKDVFVRITDLPISDQIREIRRAFPHPPSVSSRHPLRPSCPGSPSTQGCAAQQQQQQAAARHRCSTSGLGCFRALSPPHPEPAHTVAADGP